MQVKDLPVPPKPLDDDDKKTVRTLLNEIGDKELSFKVNEQIADETINKHNFTGSLAKLKRLAS